MGPVAIWQSLMGCTRMRFYVGMSLCFAITLLSSSAIGDDKKEARADISIADFEGPDYGSWKTTGEAFGDRPAQGALPGQMPVDGFQGKGLVNSFHKGDGTTGTLTSPEFVI